MKRLNNDQISDIIKGVANGERIFNICKRLGISYSAALIEEKLNKKYRDIILILVEASVKRETNNEQESAS